MSSNPVFGDGGRAFRAAARTHAGPPTPSAATLQGWYDAPSYAPARTMCIDDVVERTACVLGVVAVTFALAWSTGIGRLALPAALVGFGLAMVVAFRRSSNPALILAYAACEGVFLGAISRVFESLYSGIVVQAIIGTLGVFAGMLVVYKTGAVRVTPRFIRCLTGAMFGVLAVILVNVVASLVMGHDALGIRSGGPVAIGFTLLCIGLAAGSFLADFEMVNAAARQGAPQKFAWYAAFGLTVTLVWLYLEVLRLIGFARN